jgi:cytochrome c oxidase subunit I+III
VSVTRIAPLPSLHAEEFDAQAHEEMLRSWWTPYGPLRWFMRTDHKTIGLRYIVTALVMLAFGGLEALAIRIQLSRPENTFLTPDQYDQFFTMHGTTMMFLFAVPVMLGVGVYLVPLMIGTRELAFPRLNAFGYYTYLIGCLLLNVAFLFNTGPDSGWFAYVPLSGPEYAPGKRMNVWAQTITFGEISMMCVAVNLIVTILKHRAPGMSLNRMPLFVWSMFVTGFMVLFAMTTVATASFMLASDRLIATHFFNPAEGGDALLWQHLFWYFAHPEVYIIFVPATGIVSQLVTTFTRRPVLGYTAMVLAMVATGFISFGVWVHHMFATGIPQMGESFFSASSMLVTIPNGLQIFFWIATIWLGRPVLKLPMLFVLGFFFILVRGGLTGVMLASVAFDLQAHDTFFVVAHLHDVLIGGAVFPLIGALYYWYPKWTGRMASESLGKLSFWLLFIGQNLTFFPMHITGLEGMPRRQYTYLVESGWGTLNLVSSIGAFILASGVLVLVFNLVASLRRGSPAPENPWDADTLEWGTTSPPLVYNFLFIPFVQGRNALWDRTADAPKVVGLRTDRRNLLNTTALDAEPDIVHEVPDGTIWPFIAALGVGATFISLIFTPWAIPIGMLLVTPPLVLWGFPRHGKAHPENLVVEHP